MVIGSQDLQWLRQHPVGLLPQGLRFVVRTLATLRIGLYLQAEYYYKLKLVVPVDHESYLKAANPTCIPMTLGRLSLKLCEQKAHRKTLDEVEGGQFGLEEMCTAAVGTRASVGLQVG